MYKNQLQELAQRRGFNLPSYACIREGPDHAPTFKATVNFNGEIFEGPAFFPTLRQAEHAAAEVALNTLTKRGPSPTLAAKVLDESGVYKNLLQETAHKAGMKLPVYSIIQSGPRHAPVFLSVVELGGKSFTGEAAKTKKLAEKNAAMSAWSALKQMAQFGSSSSPLNTTSLEEQEQVVIARFLAKHSQTQSSDLLHSNTATKHRSPTTTSKTPFPSTSTTVDLPHSNPPKGHPSPTTTSKSTFPSTSTSVDSYYQKNQTSSNFTPDLTAHHIWLQEQAVEHHHRLMALGVSIPPLPPVIPWMHPLWHPNMNRAPATGRAGPVVGPALNGPTLPCGAGSFSPRPVLRRTQFRDFRVPFMARPVQIRSVVPVYSTAPPRRMNSSSSQDERSSADDLSNSSTSTGDVSRVSSNLGNLSL